jgi:SAM-dependent methyltransferase
MIKDEYDVDACHLCKSKRIRYRFVRDKNRVYQCDDCGFIFLNPQTSHEVMRGIYKENYFIEASPSGYDKDFSSMKLDTAKGYLDHLIDYYGSTSGKLLEIGYGDEKFISLARGRGFDVACAQFTEYAGNTKKESFDNLDFPDDHFDVCVLFDALEHVRQPIDLLNKIHKLLKKGGALFLVLPTLDSWSAKLMKSNWMEFKAEHLHYFDAQTIQNALARTGFHKVNVSPNYKILNMEYVNQHFSRFQVPFFSRAVSMVSVFMPKVLRKKPFKVVASGMNVLATKKDLRPNPLLSIIVPVYNEKTTFPVLMKELLAKELSGLDREIIIVESNSTDGTRDIALRYRNQPNVRVILEDCPKGKGHAVRAGLKEANGDFVMIQDGDLEYDLNDYDQLLEPLLNYSKPFVLGSRHGKGWKMRHYTKRPALTFFMNFGHWLFAGLLNIFCGSNLKDPFTMFKVFRRDCIYGLSFSANRFDFDWELVMKLLRKGYRPLEILVNYNSRSFQEGKKVSFIKDPLLWIVALFRFRFEPLYRKKKD